METTQASIYARPSVDDHPGKCRRCGTTIVTRTGLVGALDGLPVCERCLHEAHPRLGWALALAERVASASGGRWPSTAGGEELVPVFAFLESSRPFGPLTPDNIDLALALGLFQVVSDAVSHQLSRMLEYLEALAAERDVELELRADLTLDDLYETLERLDIEPRDFFLELWRREHRERGTAKER